MTNAEAIRIINQYDCNFFWPDGERIPTEDLIEAFDLAVKALDAQTPRVLPPNLYMGEAEGAYTYRCGVCGAFLMSGLKGSRLEAWADDIRDYKCYCEHCGTRIDWKGAEEP